MGNQLLQKEQELNPNFFLSQGDSLSKQNKLSFAKLMLIYRKNEIFGKAISIRNESLNSLLDSLTTVKTITSCETYTD